MNKKNETYAMSITEYPDGTNKIFIRFIGKEKGVKISENEYPKEKEKMSKTIVVDRRKEWEGRKIIDSGVTLYTETCIKVRK